VWNFGDGSQPGRFEAVDSLPSPLLDSPSLSPHCRHHRFPQDYYTEMATWSRKGWLHTRWRVGEGVIELLNIHNFHDDCNLRALQRGEGERVSVYALCRLRSLQLSVEGLRTLGQPGGGAPLGSDQPPATFVFGDFNFRCGRAQKPAPLPLLARARALAPPSFPR